MQSIVELKQTVARLRAPDGCPWDQEQTHQSICDCLVEECAELLETIDRMDMEHMCEELGDLLLHIVMHAQMAQEAGHFDLDAVARGINDKLIRRHPHVFGDIELKDTEAVLGQWEVIKASERKNGSQGDPESPFKHLPPQLPALLYARDVLKQIARKSLPAGALISSPADLESDGALTESEAGKKLFELVEACRLAGIDPESALRKHTLRVKDEVERRARGNKIPAID